ncbi:MAG: protein kinase [Aggregatilineales bacterium]
MALPESIGQYQVEAQVGIGGMATVFKAHHDRLARDVAIKVMHPNFLQDPNFRARFEREARIVARLEHPNIVPVYDFADYDGQPYLVMKYIEGDTLKEYARDNALTVNDKVALLEKVANALTYAHAQGILHRDIKPSNILIDERGTPYLTDFGLARIVQSGESTMSADMMLGTPHYISPEQAQGKIDLDARTDVYSLGIIVYELLAGRVPFRGDSTYAIVHDHIYTPPPAPSEFNDSITPQVERVLLKALAKNPQDRYDTPDAMVSDLKRALRGEQVANVRPRAEAPTTPQSKSTDDTPKRKRVDVISPPIVPSPPKPLDPIPSPLSPDFPEKVSQWAERFGQKAGEFGERFGDNAGKMGERWGDRAGQWGESVGKRIQEIAAEAESSFSGKPIPDALLSPEERIRKQVEKRIEERNGLLTHFAAYVMVNLMMWGIYLFSGGGFPWPMFVTLGWGIGMFAHYMDYRTKYGAGRVRREEMIQREIELERERLYGASQAKAKNDMFYDESSYDDADLPAGRVRLTEDGEFTDSYIEDLRDDDDDYAATGRR